MFHSPALEAKIAISREAEMSRHLMPESAVMALHGLAPVINGYAVNNQACFCHDLPDRGKIKSMGRAASMNIADQTSIIGLAALNGVVGDAFIQSSLWNQDLLQVR